VTPLYLLLALAGLLLVALLFSLLGVRKPRLIGQPFGRRRLLSAEEWRCVQQIAEAAGDSYRVFPRVAAQAVLQPLPRLGRKQRLLAEQRLREGWLDLLICAAADAHPLCAVRLDQDRLGRQEKRIGRQVQAAVSAAGMPVIELSLDDLPSSARLRALVAEAIEMADAPVVVDQPKAAAGPGVTAGVTDDDEAALLSELSTAMREPESAPDRREISANRR
jgi:hypothetical protein